jgi:transmembrane sensor
MGDQELKELLHRYKNNTATDEEKAIVESWYLQHREDDVTEYTLQQRLEDAESVWAELQPGKGERKIKPFLTRIAAAASVLVFLSADVYFILQHKQPVQQVAKIPMILPRVATKPY